MKGLNALKLGLNEKFYEESPVVAMESQGQAICCRKWFRATWWITPRESASDGTVYGLNVIHRTPPIGTLPANWEGTAHQLCNYFSARPIARRIRVIGEIRGFIIFYDAPRISRIARIGVTNRGCQTCFDDLSWEIGRSRARL